ncbi:uncharacterized protein LOC106533035, partial [Austrofundulus limnaeus]|uniref:Uncharacterized protein LOC106533035 n=1 Tax=Austrofundulus limnaeus TaxID=52670 RepID=A0A2I4CXG3_AUSLI
MKVMYARAVWKEHEQEEEGVVPVNWIDRSKNIIWWPKNMSTTKIERALKDKINPGNDWMTFPLIKIKMTSVKRRECESYNFTSHAEDDDEDQDMATTSKRIRTKKGAPAGFVSDLTSDEEESINGVRLPNFPTAPQKLPSIHKNNTDLSGFVGRQSASEEIQDGYRSRSGSGSSTMSRRVDDSSRSGSRCQVRASRSRFRRQDLTFRSRSGSRHRIHASRSRSRSGSRRQVHASGSRSQDHASRSRSGSRRRVHASGSRSQDHASRSRS